VAHWHLRIVQQSRQPTQTHDTLCHVQIWIVLLYGTPVHVAATVHRTIGQAGLPKIALGSSSGSALPEVPLRWAYLEAPSASSACTLQ
jgi:hypothetical protein